MSSDDDFHTPADLQRRQKARRNRPQSSSGRSLGVATAGAGANSQTITKGRNRQTPLPLPAARKLQKRADGSVRTAGNTPCQQLLQRCPVCGTDLDSTCTDALAQQQHLNACLDQQERAAEQQQPSRHGAHLSLPDTQGQQPVPKLLPPQFPLAPATSEQQQQQHDHGQQHPHRQQHQQQYAGLSSTSARRDGLRAAGAPEAELQEDDGCCDHIPLEGGDVQQQLFTAMPHTQQDANNDWPPCNHHAPVQQHDQCQLQVRHHQQEQQQQHRQQLQHHHQPPEQQHHHREPHHRHLLEQRQYQQQQTPDCQQRPPMHSQPPRQHTQHPTPADTARHPPEGQQVLLQSTLVDAATCDQSHPQHQQQQHRPIQQSAHNQQAQQPPSAWHQEQQVQVVRSSGDVQQGDVAQDTDEWGQQPCWELHHMLVQEPAGGGNQCHQKSQQQQKGAQPWQQPSHVPLLPLQQGQQQQEQEEMEQDACAPGEEACEPEWEVDQAWPPDGGQDDMYTLEGEAGLYTTALEEQEEQYVVEDEDAAYLPGHEEEVYVPTEEEEEEGDVYELEQPEHWQLQPGGQEEPDDDSDVAVVSPPRGHASAAVAAAAAAAAAPGPGDPADIAAWLQHLGAAQYLSCFRLAAVDLSVLPHLADSDLQELGVHDSAMRQRLLSAAVQLLLLEDDPPAAAAAGAPCHHQPAPLLGSKSTTTSTRARGITTSSSSAASSSRQPLQPLTNLLREVRPDQVQHLVDGGSSKITAFFQRPAKQQTPAAAAAPQRQQGYQQQQPRQQQQPGLQRQRQQQQQQQPAGRGPPVALTGPSGPLPSWFPVWHTLPGTPLVVDCFGPSSKGLRCRSWFLTHFHADHYRGLTKGFKQGVIYCTPVTAALTALKIKVPLSVLKPVPLGHTEVVEGTRITLLDANHCPGSAMILAEPPRGHPPVLHTGDARLSLPEMRSQPQLAALVGRGAVLVLDTTYCDPQYTFPSQQEVVDATLRAIRAESFNPRTLFLFGTYTIGKERLFLSVAEALDVQLYVAAAKRGVLGCIGLSTTQAARLTTDHLQTNYHVVPMCQVNFTAMEALLGRYKGRYTSVVGIQPTGWAQGRSSKSAKLGKRSQKGTVVLYQMPYSEHSSFTELRQFVSWLRPCRIIPSVGNDRGPKAARMLQLLQPAAEGGPMDAFIRPTAAVGGAAAATTAAGSPGGTAAGSRAAGRAAPSM